MFFMQMHMQKFSPPKFKACLPNNEFSVLVTSHPCAQSVNTSPSLQNVASVYTYTFTYAYTYTYTYTITCTCISIYDVYTYIYV